MKNWGDTLEIIFSENHFVYVIDDADHKITYTDFQKKKMIIFNVTPNSPKIVQESRLLKKIYTHLLNIPHVVPI